MNLGTQKQLDQHTIEPGQPIISPIGKMLWGNAKLAGEFVISRDTAPIALAKDSDVECFLDIQLGCHTYPIWYLSIIGGILHYGGLYCQG